MEIKDEGNHFEIIGDIIRVEICKTEDLIYIQTRDTHRLDVSERFEDIKEGQDFSSITMAIRKKHK